MYWKTGVKKRRQEMARAESESSIQRNLEEYEWEIK